MWKRYLRRNFFATSHRPCLIIRKSKQYWNVSGVLKDYIRGFHVHDLHTTEHEFFASAAFDCKSTGLAKQTAGPDSFPQYNYFKNSRLNVGDLRTGIKANGNESR